MKNWTKKYSLILSGLIVGAITGFVYWKYVGCVTGRCAITSNPFRSTVYFAVMGALLFSLFKKDDVKKPEGDQSL